MSQALAQFRFRLQQHPSRRRSPRASFRGRRVLDARSAWLGAFVMLWALIAPAGSFGASPEAQSADGAASRASAGVAVPEFAAERAGVETAQINGGTPGNAQATATQAARSRADGKPVWIQPGKWPQFRGPAGDGATPDSVVTQWSEPTEEGATAEAVRHIAWKTPLHDRGWSSPVVWDDLIWCTSATPDGTKMYALAVDLQTGQLRHDLHLFDVTKPSEIHVTNSYASPTPVLDDSRAYIHFGSYGTACLDAKTGKVLWQRRDLPCEHFRGPGSSPILFDNLLIMHFDGFDFQYVIALNKLTGETVWKVDRQIDYGTTDGDLMKAFCTPLIIRVGEQWQLISPTSKATIAYDPATGQEIWRVRYEEFSATARPLFRGDLLFVNTGFSKAQLWGIRPEGRGDLTDSQVVWKQTQAVGSKPSAVLHGDLLFGVHDAGVASCWDANTGERHWAERLGGNYSASVLLAGEHVYFFSEEGETTVVKASPQFEKVAVNKLADGCMASPAVVDGALLVRTRTHLYRLQ